MRLTLTRPMSMMDKSAIGRKLLISAQERGREMFSRSLAGIILATQTISVSNGDVLNVIFTLTCVATHTRDAISVWPKDLLPWRRYRGIMDPCGSALRLSFGIRNGKS
ncbi:hypothetical protein F5Y19DRAFT_123507 [Xylariaceae sp. FL1651]|nr:hypothetical protein F5Y19DRAFT_123507 [Xylariaceae sp. FL1651]